MLSWERELITAIAQMCGGDDTKMATSTGGEKLTYTERMSDTSDIGQQEKSYLDISKMSLQDKMSGWNMLLWEAVEFSSLEIFKIALDKATGNLT